jgi:hypothetical protein
MDGRTDRGKTVHPPPPLGSGGIKMLSGNEICAGFLSFVYICIAVGDPIIKSGGLGSHYLV